MTNTGPRLIVWSVNLRKWLDAIGILWHINYWRTRHVVGIDTVFWNKETEKVRGNHKLCLLIDQTERNGPCDNKKHNQRGRKGKGVDVQSGRRTEDDHFFVVVWIKRRCTKMFHVNAIVTNRVINICLDYFFFLWCRTIPSVGAMYGRVQIRTSHYSKNDSESYFGLPIPVLFSLCKKYKRFFMYPRCHHKYKLEWK